MNEIVQRLIDEGHYVLECWSYRLREMRGHLPSRILVGGTPKTGTTWMRRMITSIPGYRNKGNFHGDIEQYRHLALGDVVHAHDRFTPELSEILTANQIKSVITFRDPRDQVISRVFHILRDLKHPWNRDLSAMSMDDALMLCIRGQGTLPSSRSAVGVSYSWMKVESGALCVKYEDLLADTRAQLQKVLQFLQIRLPDALVQDIVERNHFARLAAGRRFWKTIRTVGSGNVDSHFRKGVAGDWHNYFKPEHVATFKELLGDRLIEMGYETDLQWSNPSLTLN